MTKLTDHFTLEELTHSDTAIRRGIDNMPPPAILKVLTLSAEKMELARALLGHPITVNSGFRAPLVNKLIGGAKNSGHMSGYAIDFTCPGFGTPKDIVKFLATQPTFVFDQLIQEGTWVHVSFAPASRREILTAHFGKSGTTYTKGLT